MNFDPRGGAKRRGKFLRPGRFHSPAGVVQVTRQETGTRGPIREATKRMEQDWRTVPDARWYPKTGDFLAPSSMNHKLPQHLSMKE